ncbi:MAG: helix-turn-helix domain-containing protein [Bacillota bacterium]|jgi:transcriptional regulator with XRE-family HTH domain
MKINQIIREKRKELSLTQEQIAECLGVSAPAVHKWEKGSTYPDITLLPALARLLKTDLNTLLSFNEDLTDTEIEGFVCEVDETVQKQGYETAFHKAIDKIHEYPNCDKLIYSVIIYLEGALFLYNISNPESYREVFEGFYKRLAVNETQEIRDTAICMLISYARNNGKFAEAEELINTLPLSAIDKEEQLAILCQKQKKYAEAEKIWEHRLLKSVTDIQTALMNLLELAWIDRRYDAAEALADMCETVTRQFDFPEWMRYNAHLGLALEKKNQEECLSILKKMLPAMKKKWNPQGCKLYRNLGGGENTFLSSRIADTLCDELINNEEYAFLRECAEFEKLMAEINS